MKNFLKSEKRLKLSVLKLIILKINKAMKIETNTEMVYGANLTTLNGQLAPAGGI